MIGFIFRLFDAWLDTIEHKRLEVYLADAKDLGEVERRLRIRENGGTFR